MVFIGTVISGLCGAGISPAVAGSCRTHVRARCSGRDARTTAGKMPAPHHGLTLALVNLIILKRLIEWPARGKQGGEGARCSPPP